MKQTMRLTGISEGEGDGQVALCHLPYFDHGH